MGKIVSFYEQVPLFDRMPPKMLSFLETAKALRNKKVRITLEGSNVVMRAELHEARIIKDKTGKFIGELELTPEWFNSPMKRQTRNFHEVSGIVEDARPPASPLQKPVPQETKSIWRRFFV